MEKLADSIHKVVKSKKGKRHYEKEKTKVLDERVSTLALQLDDGARLLL